MDNLVLNLEIWKYIYELCRSYDDVKRNINVQLPYTSLLIVPARTDYVPGSGGRRTVKIAW